MTPVGSLISVVLVQRVLWGRVGVAGRAGRVGWDGRVRRRAGPSHCQRVESSRGFAERLLLGLLEVWVGAGGVVGDVDDAVDLGHGLGDRHFDALAEGDCGHAAALAPAA